MIAASAAVALIVGTLYTSRLKADDNQDQKDKVERVLAIAAVPLNLNGKDRQLVGLGSYIVNGQIDCNGCNSMSPQRSSRRFRLVSLPRRVWLSLKLTACPCTGAERCTHRTTQPGPPPLRVGALLDSVFFVKARSS